MTCLKRGVIISMVNSSGFSKENMVKESGHFADFQKSVVDPGFQEESVLSSKKRRQSYIFPNFSEMNSMQLRKYCFASGGASFTLDLSMQFK